MYSRIIPATSHRLALFVLAHFSWDADAPKSWWDYRWDEAMAHGYPR